MEYADLPGILEDLLREMAVENVEVNSFLDPYNVSSITKLIRESRVIECKIRGWIAGDRLHQNSTWLPSRFSAKLVKVDNRYVMRLACGDPVVPVNIACTKGENLTIDATRIDGALTIITGKKESGKSHTVKAIIMELVAKGCIVVVFDINGEYVGLGSDEKGNPTEIASMMDVLVPGKNFKIGLRSMGVKAMANVLEYALNTPQNSVREFINIWEALEGANNLNIKSLLDAVRFRHMNESVREALLSRLQTIFGSNVISDDSGDPLEESIADGNRGLLLVIRLDRLMSYIRRLIVEYVLTRLSILLLSNKIPPIFLVAEEAHLYLRETYWDDMVTRMRHIGVSPIIVTNQPDSVPETIYRQADNVFLFNFTNERDLENISKSTNVDVETVKKIVPNLPRGSALLIGRLVNDVPMVINVKRIGALTLGETKSFFKEQKRSVIGVTS
ncbi:MAG: DUF87 domain-containing protein [Aigarchaeota archaeon]|nr:DUF87 domain-containing protein [Aigarchaeota archaeon]MDW8093167.1 DUF87 domain-containing protein [Nitrososphaerota archaeon]